MVGREGEIFGKGFECGLLVKLFGGVIRDVVHVDAGVDVVRAKLMDRVGGNGSGDWLSEAKRDVQVVRGSCPELARGMEIDV